MKYLIKSKNFYVDILVIIIGSFISSLGVNLFLSTAKLLSGGVTGIALILQYLWEVPSGITVFLLNIPLFFVSYKYLNKRFTIYTAIGMLSFSTALMITKPLSTLVQVDDMLLYCIYGGVLSGIGSGLIFYRNGSTGGTDIITMVIRKKYSNFDIGQVGFAFNLIIVSVSIFIFGLPISDNLHKPFIPVRKKGKLPCETVSIQYDLEYGSAEIEMHKNSIKPGQKVVIIDDLMATGGTIEAITKLIEGMGGVIVKAVFLMELEGLEGRKRLEGFDVETVIAYPGK